MSDPDDFGIGSMNFDGPQYGGNYHSLAGNPSISPNSKYDTSFTFDSDDAINGGDSDRDMHIPERPRSPRNRYDMYDDSAYQYKSPTPPRANSPDESAMADPSSPELSSLFAIISNFEPQPVELTVHWKQYQPDLQLANGAIDAFIKHPRPDGELDDLGLVILDEPSISQSNPQILKMELREQYGLVSPASQSDAYIGCIEEPQKNSKALTSWLDSLEEIHRQRPPPSVIYTSPMPELEALMDPWPEKFEGALQSLIVPSCELDLSFEDYARVVCAILEIPVRGNIIESLHHLFSLYSEFASNQHFMAQRQGGSQ